MDNPHTKVFLLMQAHLSRVPLPNSDYGTDTKSVLDQSIRIIQVRCVPVRMSNMAPFICSPSSISGYDRHYGRTGLAGEHPSNPATNAMYRSSSLDRRSCGDDTPKRRTTQCTRVQPHQTGVSRASRSALPFIISTNIFTSLRFQSPIPNSSSTEGKV